MTGLSVSEAAQLCKESADILETLDYVHYEFTPAERERLTRFERDAKAVISLQLEIAADIARTAVITAPPRVTEGQRGVMHLTGRSFTYVAFGRAGEILYIGVTDDVFGRMNGHHRTSPWWDKCDRVQWTEWPDRATAEAQETRLISLHRPPFNTSGNPDRYRPKKEQG